MYSISLGFVNVATAGTPVPMSSVLTTLGWDVNLKVHKLVFNPKSANTHVGFVGLAGTTNGGRTPQAPAGDFNKTSGVGLIAECQPPAGVAGKKDPFVACAGEESNVVRISDYAVDAGANGEGFVIYAEVA